MIVMPLSILLLPYFQATSGLVERKGAFTEFLIEAVANRLRSGKCENQGPRKKGHGEWGAELLRSIKNEDDSQLEKTIESIVKAILKERPEIISWYDGLFELALCSCWTSYEILCGDLWEDFVNSSIHAARNVCKVESSSKESKKFDLSDLFDYDLDLSDKMGSYLKERFKFTGTAQIDSAFRIAFGEKPIKYINIHEKTLFQVEQKRHLYMHKGGLVDKEFKRKTTSSLPIGHKLRLTAHELSDDMGAIFQEGMCLLERTDSWLRKH